MKMLVHAFVMSRVDYCNAILVGSPRYITDKLQSLLNAAARLITAIRKFDHGLSFLLHDRVTCATKQIEPDSKDTDATNSYHEKVQIKLVCNTLQK